MHFEPPLYEHVEAMVAIALAPEGGLDAAAVAQQLSRDLDEASAVLANLAAGGLLECRGEDGASAPTYHLARRPGAIRLDEVAAVARLRHGGEAEDRGNGGAGARSSDRALRHHLLQALAQFKLADMLPAAPPASASRLHPRAAAWGGNQARSGMRLRAPIRPVRPGMTVERLLRLVAAGDAPVVIDVRATPAAALPAPSGAHWIPLEELAAHAHRWSPDACIVTVCGTGIRSFVAASYLRWCGYRRAHHLIGGLEAWHRRQA